MENAKYKIFAGPFRPVRSCTNFVGRTHESADQVPTITLPDRSARLPPDLSLRGPSGPWQSPASILGFPETKGGSGAVDRWQDFLFRHILPGDCHVGLCPPRNDILFDGWYRWTVGIATACGFAMTW